MVQEELEQGTLLNQRYQIIRALGRGGMGTVYLAEHLRLGGVVAVKEVRGVDRRGEAFQEALTQSEQEARFLFRLHHANLPKVMDAFVESDRFYLVMEFIEGITLDARLRELGGGGLPVSEVIEYGLQIADVLAYLHTQDPPIIFRDLKPANVMVQPDNNVRLIDFGIARRFHPEAEKDTALLGSVGYSPPEQFGRTQTDARSDIYAFGATLHQLLTGRDPAIQPFKFPPAHTLNAAVSEPLSALLDSCLAMDQARRPGTINEVANGLIAIRDGLPPDTPGEESGATTPVTEGESPTNKPSIRIVSAKIAEAEAQKRRSGSREVKPTSAVPAPSASRPVVQRAVLALLLLLVVGGSGGAVWWMRRPIKVPPPTQNHPKPPPERPEPTPPKPVDSAPSAALMPPSVVGESPVTITLQDQEILPGTPEGDILRQHAKLQMRGVTGKEGRFALFLYDAEDKPIQAADPQSLYANSQGQLSVARKVPITEGGPAQDVTVDMPLNNLPEAARSTSLRFRTAFFIDGKVMASTEIAPVDPKERKVTPLPNPPNTGPDAR